MLAVVLVLELLFVGEELGEGWLDEGGFLLDLFLDVLQKLVVDCGQFGEEQGNLGFW